jgi:hypothetical protein
MQLGVDQLPLVWNALWDAGEDRIAIDHPAEALAPLCTVTLDETVTLQPQAIETYAAARTAVATEWGEDVVAELPTASSVCGAYLAAGIIAPANATAIAETVEATGGADLTAGHRPVMVGFATAGTDAPYDGYALATGVRDELQWDAKVSDTHRLERALGAEFTALWNQPAGQRREGRLAEVMYRRLRDRREGTEVQSATGDDAITEGYDTMRADQRCDVVLFRTRSPRGTTRCGRTSGAMWCCSARTATSSSGHRGVASPERGWSCRGRCRRGCGPTGPDWGGSCTTSRCCSGCCGCRG